MLVFVELPDKEHDPPAKHSKLAQCLASGMHLCRPNPRWNESWQKARGQQARLSCNGAVPDDVMRCRLAHKAAVLESRG